MVLLALHLSQRSSRFMFKHQKFVQVLKSFLLAYIYLMRKSSIQNFSSVSTKIYYIILIYIYYIFKYFCFGKNKTSVTLPSSLSSRASTPVLSVNSFTLTAGRGCVVVKSPWVPQLKDTKILPRLASVLFARTSSLASIDFLLVNKS